jgi:hypothetical protein
VQTIASRAQAQAQAQIYGPPPSPVPAQYAMPPAPASADPMGAVWSLVGSSPIVGILYFLLRGEQAERRAAIDRMVQMFEADAAHKAELRERLKGQDGLATKVIDTQAKQGEILRSLEQRLPPVRPGP